MRDMRSAAVFVTLFLTMMNPVFAQSPEPAKTKPAGQTKQAENKTKTNKPKPATYLKAYLIHGDFELHGFNYHFNDLDFEVEHYWTGRHLGLAGFAIGYRKEDFSSADYGHFLNSKVFWKAEKNGFYFKPGVGAEWGKPSPRFEQTHFRYTGVKLVSYERIYLERNAWMPVGVKNTGILNPFFEIGIGQKAGPVIFEGGTRIGYDKFVTDTFQLKDGYLTFQSLNGTYDFVPTLYVSIGFKMF